MSWSAAVLAVCLFMAAMVGFWPRPSIQPLQLATTTSAPEQPLRSNIEDLKVGDYVLAKDPETGEISQRKITRLFRRESDHLRVLQLRSPMGQTQFIRTTDEHPFFLHDESQKLAGELRVGDLVSHGNGNASQIISSLREEHPEGIEVFNFEVEVDHTYFVSGDLNASVPLWVHNDCVYVHVDAQDNITYIGITNDFHRRAGEHFEDGTKSGVRMLQVTDDYTGKDAHDIVRTLEGKLIRQKIKDAKVDETLPVKEQLELADLDNLNRGRIEERFEKGVEIEDHVYDITDAIDEAPIK